MNIAAGALLITLAPCITLVAQRTIDSATYHKHCVSEGCVPGTPLLEAWGAHPPEARRPQRPRLGYRSSSHLRSTNRGQDIN